MKLESTSFTETLDMDGRLWYTDAVEDTENLTLINEENHEA